MDATTRRSRRSLTVVAGIWAVEGLGDPQRAHRKRAISADESIGVTMAARSSSANPARMPFRLPRICPVPQEKRTIVDEVYEVPGNVANS